MADEKTDKEKQEKKMEIPDPLVERIREISGIKKEEKLKETEKAIDEDRHKMLAMSEIGIWIDNYDDIFSDFDPRPYALRSLSDDFLNEARKASIDKGPGKLELRILIDEKMRNLKEEVNIKKRLKDHFTKHAMQLKKEIKKSRINAMNLLILGFTLMMAATFLNLKDGGFAKTLILVIIEPTGWFMVWFAFDNLFYNKEKVKNWDFYSKMAKAEIMFSSY